MSTWQPIETAPKGGTILVTDGVRFAAADHEVHVEGPLTHVWSGRLGEKGSVLSWVPNPNAGQERDWWRTIGCSAFKDNANDYADDDGRPALFEPTHWMPLPEPPQKESPASSITTASRAS